MMQVSSLILIQIISQLVIVASYPFFFFQFRIGVSLLAQELSQGDKLIIGSLANHCLQEVSKKRVSDKWMR